MSLNIVDKRPVRRDRATENRHRFLKRIKETIKDQLPHIIQDKALRDIGTDGGKVRVKKKTIEEPFFRHAAGGVVDSVVTGNHEYVPGDIVPKPPRGGGRGDGDDEAGTGQSEDDFIIELSRDEFLNYFFEDLELPDMIRFELSKIKEKKKENAGFQVDGSPNRLSVIRSYKQALARRLPIFMRIDEEIANLEQMLIDRTSLLGGPVMIRDQNGELEVIVTDLAPETTQIRETIEWLKTKRASVTMFEDVDLRYRTFVNREIPIAHATMIMIMDNSGSMGIKEKTIARKFFWLLFSFLEREYDQVDMIFISHTDEAIEMDEEEFFNTHDSGGTVVSSALTLASEIIQESLVGKTNIYVAQVSDGDNSSTDNGTCSELLEDDILPHVRYFSYVQVDNYHDEDSLSLPSALMNTSGLWKSYQTVSEQNQKLQMKRVYAERDIYPVFRELFKKR